MRIKMLLKELSMLLFLYVICLSLGTIISILIFGIDGLKEYSKFLTLRSVVISSSLGELNLSKVFAIQAILYSFYSIIFPLISVKKLKLKFISIWQSIKVKIVDYYVISYVFGMFFIFYTLQASSSHGSYNLASKFLVFIFLFIGAFAEEITHRVILYNGFKYKYDISYAILITSIFFSISHIDLDPINILSRYFLGVTFAVIYELSGSLTTISILHTLHNFGYLYSKTGWVISTFSVSPFFLSSIPLLLYSIYSFRKIRSNYYELSNVASLNTNRQEKQQQHKNNMKIIEFILFIGILTIGPLQKFEVLAKGIFKALIFILAAILLFSDIYRKSINKILSSIAKHKIKDSVDFLELLVNIWFYFSILVLTSDFVIFFIPFIYWNMIRRYKFSLKRLAVFFAMFLTLFLLLLNLNAVGIFNINTFWKKIFFSTFVLLPVTFIEYPPKMIKYPEIPTLTFLLWLYSIIRIGVLNNIFVLDQFIFVVTLLFASRTYQELKLVEQIKLYSKINV